MNTIIYNYSNKNTLIKRHQKGKICIKNKPVGGNRDFTNPIWFHVSLLQGRKLYFLSFFIYMFFLLFFAIDRGLHNNKIKLSQRIANIQVTFIPYALTVFIEITWRKLDIHIMLDSMCLIYQLIINIYTWIKFQVT